METSYKSLGLGLPILKFYLLLGSVPETRTPLVRTAFLLQNPKAPYLIHNSLKPQRAMASTNLLPLRNSLSPSGISTLYPSLHKSISKSLLSFSYSTPSPSFQTSFTRPVNPFEQSRLVCRMCEYKFPDPIPEFADHVSFSV